MFPLEQNSFRQVCDKPCSHAIYQAEWSPLRDLIAVVTSNGDVRLHRMHWQKVWVHYSKSKKAKCVAWTPCGKTLAVGYDNGSIELIEIEKCKIIHSVQCEGTISCLKWNTRLAAEETNSKYKEGISEYLPMFQKEEILASLKNTDLILHDELIILIVGTSIGKTYVFVDGVFLITEIDVCKFTNTETSFDILQAHCDLNEGNINIVCKSLNDKKYYYKSFHSQLLSARHQELLFLSQKYFRCSTLFSKLSACFQQMCDTSEDVYIKITSRIKSLEKMIALNNSSIALEFTMAYLTGIASPELQMFFAQDLTSKALAQLAQNVDLSYNSLQSDINNEFTLYLQHLNLYITELEGMSSWFEKFGILGLSSESVKKVKQLLIQMNAKVHRLKLLIVNDRKYFHVFFTWLKGFIHESNNETSLLKLEPFDDKDYDMMLEFLEKRLLKNSENDCYNFEQVNQFFKKDFVENFKSPDNEFLKFIQENEKMKNSPFIFVPDNTLSFPDLVTSFAKQLDGLFSNISTTLSESIVSNLSFCLYTHVDGHADECTPSFEFLSLKKNKYLSIIPCSCDSTNMYILQDSSNSKFAISGISIDRDESLNESMEVLTTLKNAKFYNDDTLTLLFECEDQNTRTTSSYLGQVCLSDALEKNLLIDEKRNSNGLLESADIPVPLNFVLEQISEIRKIDSFSSKFVSVNGYSRQVSIVVSMTGRRIRVFDMTADDDVEETREESKLGQSQTENSLNNENNDANISSE